MTREARGTSGARPERSGGLEDASGERSDPRAASASDSRAPATRAHLAGDCRVVDAPGEGYVADLDYALDAVGRPALTVVADLPLLAAAPVDRALAAARGADDGGDGVGADPEGAVRSLAVHVPAALKRALGASVDATIERDGRTLTPTGLNVVADGSEAVRVSHDARLAVNVNRPTDLDLAEALCD